MILAQTLLLPLGTKKLEVLCAIPSMKEIDEAKKAKAHQDERLASQDENKASDLKKRLAPLGKV